MSMLADYIDDVDTCNEVELHTKEAMAVSLGKFVQGAVEKFIAGQREHGGDLADRDLDEEIRKEHIDMFWYSAAKTWKENK